MPTYQWRWLSYHDPFWSWPVNHFDDRGAWEEAVFDVAIRMAVRSVSTDFPQTTLLRRTWYLRQALDNVQADLVAEARAEGVSWARIGAALGVGRTAAHKRYGQGLKPYRKKQLEQETEAVISWARAFLNDRADHGDDGDEDADHGDREEVADFLEQLLERRSPGR